MNCIFRDCALCTEFDSKYLGSYIVSFASYESTIYFYFSINMSFQITKKCEAILLFKNQIFYFSLDFLKFVDLKILGEGGYFSKLKHWKMSSFARKFSFTRKPSSEPRKVSDGLNALVGCTILTSGSVGAGVEIAASATSKFQNPPHHQEEEVNLLIINTLQK